MYSLGLALLQRRMVRKNTGDMGSSQGWDEGWKHGLWGSYSQAGHTGLSLPRGNQRHFPMAHSLPPSLGHDTMAFIRKIKQQSGHLSPTWRRDCRNSKSAEEKSQTRDSLVSEMQVQGRQYLWIHNVQVALLKFKVTGAEQGYLTLSSCGRYILFLSQPPQSKECPS